MKQSVLNRYAPFLALAALQLFLVTMTDSRPASQTLTSGDVAGASATNGEVAAGPTGTDGSTAVTAGDGSTTGATTAGAAATGGAAAGATGGGAVAATAGSMTPTNDKSKCAPGGLLQENITFQSPPCFPKYAGDNGGATYQGVTKDKITVVIYYPQYADGTQQVLAANNLAMTPEKGAEVHGILQRFFNKHYEFYGRQLDIKYYSTEAADAAALRADAKAIVEKFKPFAVLYYAQGLGPSPFHEQLARLNTLNLGVVPVGDEFFINNSPYVWSQVIQGYRMKDLAAEFYCKRMYGKNANHAGDPQLRLQKRRLGIASSELPESVAAAKRFYENVTGKMCGTKNDGTKMYTFSADPDVADDQRAALVTRLKQDGITTLHGTTVCAEGDNQNYYPEIFVSEVFDDDFVGRVYGALCSLNQTNNVFGIGMFPRASPVREKEWYRAMQDVQPGYNGPYLSEGPFQGLAFLSRLIQYAGPNLTPQAVLAGARKTPQIGGYRYLAGSPWPGWKCCNPYTPMYHVGANAQSYTAKYDARQIYWSGTARSEGDGVNGAWVGVDGSKRYSLGEWTRGEPKQP